MKTFLIADTHFNHTNIIKYCNRPFKDINEMNETLIKNWNEVISKDDLVYHLGDFGFFNNDELKELLKLLNGTKILLLGNHDLRRVVTTWKDLGFKEVYKKEIRLGKYILTHRPIHVEEEFINIFGHIHENELYGNFNKDNHINISIDVTNFYPVLFSENEGIKLLNSKKI